MEDREEVKPEPPRPRRKIPGTGNLYVCGDGKAYRWDKSGWHELKPFCRQGEDLMYSVRLYGRDEYFTLPEMVVLAEQGEEQPSGRTLARDAKAYRVAAQFLRDNFEKYTGYDGATPREIRRVAKQLDKLAEDAERKSDSRAPSRATRVR